MSNLTTYLNDHHAGSVGALELLSRMVNEAPAVQKTKLKALKAEIEADQKTLEQLIEFQGDNPSEPKKNVAWIAEKLFRPKLMLSEADGLGLFQALEVLSLGIHGKLCLWRALKVALPDSANLSFLNLSVLETRAKDQLDLVESMRLSAGARALTVPANH